MISTTSQPSALSLIAMMFLLCVRPTLGCAQGNAPTGDPEPLAPSAQEALNKGISAAKVSDYLQASPGELNVTGTHLTTAADNNHIAFC